MTRRAPAEAEDTGPGVEAAAARVAESIADGWNVGLGSGRAATRFIQHLGRRVRNGLRVHGVPTSVATGLLASDLGIPIGEPTEDVMLDVTVDGADEVAPNLDLIKGLGGALVRERIVASASRRLVILVGVEKLVRKLGQRVPLPVEVIPFACGPVVRRLRDLDLVPVLRIQEPGSRPFGSDNGNFILDCALNEPLPDRPAALKLDRAIRSIAGVVDTGLFLGLAHEVCVGYPDGHVDLLAGTASGSF